LKRIPRVAAIHDLSCFGRCSLAVILPVLSAMAVQCCPVPTAVLSSHTGGFDRIARTELTDQMTGTVAQWQKLPLRFEGIYTGYMSSAAQIVQTGEAIERLKGPDGLAVVDPVLGDHGKLYRSITDEMVTAMGQLCRRADVITPNLTEANLLLGRTPDAAVEDGEEMAKALSDGGRRSVVITGISPQPELVGAAWYDRTTGTAATALGPRVAAAYPGTGDLFAAVLTGGLVRGEWLKDSVMRAVSFVQLCARHTLERGLPAREGVEFEPLLHRLVPDP